MEVFEEVHEDELLVWPRGKHHENFDNVEIQVHSERL